MKAPGFLNKRSGTVLFALAALPLLATPVQVRDGGPDRLPPARTTLSAEPLRFHAEQSGTNRGGAVEFLGGWVLTSEDPRFGGISAMHVSGGVATAISDAGVLLRFALPGVAGFGAVTAAALPQGPMPNRRKSDRDAEAMVVHDGQAWIVWEWRRQVWRYDARTWRAQAAARPAAIRRLGRSNGAEALVRLADGRFLMLSETMAGGGVSRALLFAGDPTASAPAELSYRPPSGFRATDAALLPDGRVLVLNRRFNLLEGLGAALVAVDPAAVRPGAVVEGREIARLQWPLALDNMEALAVTREGGRTILWIASDDNFNPLQRTLLMRFALVE
jgi:hypothetical protein